MRLFVGIPLPEDVVTHLQKVRQAIAPHLPKVSWTRPENLHVTLKFLGEAAENRVADIAARLQQVTAPLFRLRADGMESFPPHGQIRIIAVRFGGNGIATLAELQRQIEAACADLGFERERRMYHPHATLARTRGPLRAELRTAIEERTRTLWPGPLFPVTDYVLFDSRQVGQVRQYAAAARVRLAIDGGPCSSA